MTNLIPGTVLYSSNLDMRQNAPVGIVNHLAIYVGDGKIVESQKDLNGKSGVLLTDFTEYKTRKYQWNVLYPKDKNIGIKAAEFAKTLVGKRYGQLSSIRKHTSEHSRKLNCTSVIALSYAHASGKEIKLTVPDEIFKRHDIFTDKLV